jgi:hypothetical protein
LEPGFLQVQCTECYHQHLASSLYRNKVFILLALCVLFLLLCSSSVISVNLEAIGSPDSENLLECARYRIKAVDKMSNPQPSRVILRLEPVRKSLVMIRAGLVIVGGDTSIRDGLIVRLKSSADCGVIRLAHVQVQLTNVFNQEAYYQ